MKTVTVDVHEFGSFRDEETITVADLVASISKIPPEHHASAVLSVDVYGDYASAHIGLRYTRPETDGERQKRERDETERQAAEAKQRYENTYQTYLMLKARFEPTK